MSRLGLLTLAVVLLIGPASATDGREITDMTGRVVRVPERVERVITLGSVPVINGFVFATGNAGRIVSGLPDRFARAGRWRFQYVFAPQIASAPDLQDANYAPDLERILALAPDVALTFDQASADLLQTNGVPTLVLRVREPDEVIGAVTLVGELFGNTEIGPRYAAYFHGVLERVAARLARVAEAQRPRVLYLNPLNMTQPHLIAEWWLKAGGARSVTEDGRTQETLALTVESVVGSDPDVIVLADPRHRKALEEHSTLARLRAVRENRILITPIGAHIWGNRTVEQPLTVLWLASSLYPDMFPRGELEQEVRAFYKSFFSIDLSDEQIATMLSGKE